MCCIYIVLLSKVLYNFSLIHPLTLINTLMAVSYHAGCRLRTGAAGTGQSLVPFLTQFTLILLYVDLYFQWLFDYPALLPHHHIFYFSFCLSLKSKMTNHKLSWVVWLCFYAGSCHLSMNYNVLNNSPVDGFIVVLQLDIKPFYEWDQSIVHGQQSQNKTEMHNEVIIKPSKY